MTDSEQERCLKTDTTERVSPRRRPWTCDRFMAPDIEATVELLQQDIVWDAVKHHLQDFESKDVRHLRSLDLPVSPTPIHLLPLLLLFSGG